jgi:hypothetical protein
MDRFKISLLVAMFLACIPVFAALGQDKGKSAPASGEVLTILPEETDELIANPGIVTVNGWMPGSLKTFTEDFFR